MITLIATELRKLGGSLALVLALLAPALPGALVGLALLTSRRASAWNSVFTQFALPIWVLFLAPMALAAFATLVGQIEHRSRGWDHLLALPVARWQVFAAKTAVVLAAVVAMAALMVAFVLLGAATAGALGGFRPTGTVPWAMLGERVPLLLAGSGLMVAVQLWAGLRFANFVVPLALGIGGTMVALAVAMTGTAQADYFPWVLPLRVLRAPDPVPLALIGGVGGLVVLAMMIADLSRRGVR